MFICVLVIAISSIGLGILSSHTYQLATGKQYRAIQERESTVGIEQKRNINDYIIFLRIARVITFILAVGLMLLGIYSVLVIPNTFNCEYRLNDLSFTSLDNIEYTVQGSIEYKIVDSLGGVYSEIPFINHIEFNAKTPIFNHTSINSSTRKELTDYFSQYTSTELKNITQSNLDTLKEDLNTRLGIKCGEFNITLVEEGETKRTNEIDYVTRKELDS